MKTQIGGILIYLYMSLVCFYISLVALINLLVHFTFIEYFVQDVSKFHFQALNPRVLEIWVCSGRTTIFKYLFPIIQKAAPNQHITWLVSGPRHFQQSLAQKPLRRVIKTFPQLSIMWTIYLKWVILYSYWKTKKFSFNKSYYCS